MKGKIMFSRKPSEQTKEDGTQFVANEDIDQEGYRGTYEEWFQYLLDPNGPGMSWYSEYVRNFRSHPNAEGGPLSCTAWIEDVLEDSLTEADEDDMNKPSLGD